MGGLLNAVPIALLLLAGFCTESKGYAATNRAVELKQKFANKTNEEKGTILAKVFDESKDYIKSAINNTVVTVSGYDELIPSKYYDDINKIINNLDFDEPSVEGAPGSEAVPREQVKYFLCTRSKCNVEISGNNTETFPTNYRDYIFVIHGWRSGRNKTWVENVTAAVLKQSDVAIIQVDWSEPADQLYAIAAFINVRAVGTIIGDFIVKLNKEKNVDLDRVTFIGHSLGAHVSGFAAKQVYNTLNQKVAKIFGLDPAGPLFTKKGENDRLSKNDARVVVILHTDGGKFGYKPSFGAIDFYANTGSAIQPGCLESISVKNITSAVFCSHARAPIYFTEALEGKNIIGLQCASYEIFSSGGCSKNRAFTLLNDALEPRGDYYFKTEDTSPYIRKQLETGDE